METKDLIAIIDDAAIKAMDMPEGFVFLMPKALQELSPEQLLALADHYGVEPSRDHGGRAEISVGSVGLSIKAVTGKINFPPDRSMREILTTSAQ